MNPPVKSPIPTNRTNHAGLYLHIPFCLQKCPYCDFYSVTDKDLIEPFVSALVQEAVLSDSRGFRFDTVYLGGGTPSVLSLDAVARLIDTTLTVFQTASDSEITIEVNPGTVDGDRLNAYRDLGINRINIGAQSFQENNLHFLGRIHNASEARQAIKDARSAGFDNIGIDLIYGLPGQDLNAWLADLSVAGQFMPEHLSCYMLTYEADTLLDRQRTAGTVRPLGDERCADLFEATVTSLDRAGYAQYEVSNFARTPAYQSRHNWKYWSLVPYMGLGPSAHSFVMPERYWNVRSVTAYIDQVAHGVRPIEEKEMLNREQQMTEYIYLGLRTVEGIDLAGFDNRFKVDFLSVYRETIHVLEQEKLAEISATRLTLTVKGLLLLDSIAGMFGTK
ncbi:radical SAM family heme chaperone HemW [Thermodesulfobacteriota bacterium]